MTKTMEIGKHCTTVGTDSAGVTAVRYHSTDVVKFDRDTITLDSGGYRTYTTKTRMNQAANQFGLGFTVYQRNFDWFVAVGYDWDNPIPFVDGMQIERK